MRFLSPILNAWRLKILARKKPDQKKRFEELVARFESLYRSVSSYPTKADFITPFWNDIRKDLEPALLPHPPSGFFQIPWIRDTMVAPIKKRWVEEELGFLSQYSSPAHLAPLLEEDFIGAPTLLQPYSTSANTLHHAYHWMKFFETTKTSFQDFPTIVEWGGGYGNAAKLFRRMSQREHTYIIIDLPIFSCIQWLYLASILGPDAVTLHTTPNQAIKKGAINLVALPFIENVTISADLFVSTWALSESNNYAQDFVVNKNWFNAKHLLLAFQETNESIPFGSRMGELAQKAGAQVEKIPFIKKSSYAFR